MKINWALLGLLAGIGIGVFAQGFTVEWLIAQVDAHIAWIVVACFLAFFLVFALSALLQRLIRRQLKPKYETVSDVVGDASEVVARAAGLSAEDTENSSQILRSGVAIYGAWSFRLLMLRATVGLLLALGGVFTTYLLIQQNERIAEQTVAVEAQTLAAESQTELLTQQLNLSSAQNELMALNLVVSLRERLTEAPVPAEDFAALFFDRLASPVSDTCSLVPAAERPDFYPGPNQSEIEAIVGLVQSDRLGARVRDALGYLLSDKNPSVVLAALLILDASNAIPKGRGPVRLSGLALDSLTLENAVEVEIVDAQIGNFSCAECEVSVMSSWVMNISAAKIDQIFSSAINGFRPLGVPTPLTDFETLMEDFNRREQAMLDALKEVWVRNTLLTHTLSIEPVRSIDRSTAFAVLDNGDPQLLPEAAAPLGLMALRGGVRRAGMSPMGSFQLYGNDGVLELSGFDFDSSAETCRRLETFARQNPFVDVSLEPFANMFVVPDVFDPSVSPLFEPVPLGEPTPD